jgi:uncharacterized damage-inducible protein DinB
MDDKTLFLKFWEREAPATRKVISRIPQEKSDYRHDPKSRTARQIAWLLVEEERLLVEGLERGSIVWEEVPIPATVEEILAHYDRLHDTLLDRLRHLDARAWERQVPFLAGGQEIMKEPGSEHAWITLFDQVHHRGQLSTYLRPMGSKVPSIYGPSADEPM